MHTLPTLRSSDLLKKMLDFEYIGWEPFGLKGLTVRDWDDLVTWYVTKKATGGLDTLEVFDYANQL